MKLLPLVAVLSVLSAPAYATDSDLSEEKLTPVSDGGADVLVTESEIDTTNPEIKFPHGLQIGVGVSATSGLNGFVGYANKNFDSFWWKRFGVRFDFATTAPLKSVIDSGIDSIMGDGIELGDGLSINNGSIKSHHFAALIDFYPFGDTWFLGGIRISGGYYFGNMDISADLTGAVSELPDSEFAFELNGQNYKYSGNSVHGTANLDWNYNGPYLGAGFDIGLFAGLKIYFDAGVVFTNRAAELGLDIPLGGLQVFENGGWRPVSGALVDDFNQAKQDALADAQSELDKLTFYPMVKIGFMYRF